MVPRLLLVLLLVVAVVEGRGGRVEARAAQLTVWCPGHAHSYKVGGYRRVRVGETLGEHYLVVVRRPT